MEEGSEKKPYILRQENQNCRLQGKKEREFVIQHLCLNGSLGKGKHSAKIKGKRKNYITLVPHWGMKNLTI